MDVVLLVNVTELLILGRCRTKKEEFVQYLLIEVKLMHLFHFQKSKCPFFDYFDYFLKSYEREK